MATTCQPLVIDAPCRVSSGTYLRCALGMWFSRHWWWMAVLAAGCLALLVVSVKWGIIAFILTIMALMMIMSLVYFNFIFSPLARWSVMEKTATVDGRGIRFSFEHPRMDDHEVEWECVRSIQFHPDYIVVHVSCDVDNNKALPASAINFLLLPGMPEDDVLALKRLYLGK